MKPEASRKNEANLERKLPSLDTPLTARKRRLIPRFNMSPDLFGRVSEAFARFMGTPTFLVGMTIFCAVWLAWNTLLPESLQFDPRALNFTLLTLILSLQASYAAPLLLLAQNRQDDRDRVQSDHDRRNAERNHATTDFITREIAALRIAMGDMATRDFVRGELRDLVEEDGDLERALRDSMTRMMEQVRAEVRDEIRQELRALQEGGVRENAAEAEVQSTGEAAK